MDLTAPRHGRSTLWAAALVAILSVVSAGCGADDTRLPSPVATVHMGEYFYRPAELTVGRGSTVSVVNDGALAHSWILKGQGVGTGDLAPGQSITVDLRGVAPGSYPIFCDQTGHTQSGQSGRLTITA